MGVIISSSPLPGLAVRQMNGSKWYLTLEDYELRLLLDGVPGSITVPAGYRYDRSSIPDVAAWLVSKDDLGCVAPLIHDAIYNQRGSMAYQPPGSARDKAWAFPFVRLSRADADEVFHAAMLEDRVRPWRARLAYWAVRLFGGKW